MINLVLEKEAIDSVEEIAERFDEEELKAVVADGRLVEWLADRFEDEIAERVKALGSDTGGDDFTDRLIAALWPDAGAEEAKTARAHVVAVREQAAEAERQRQAQAEAAAAKAEAERRAKEEEAERLAAAEAERRKLQEEAEAARAAEEAKMAARLVVNQKLADKVVNLIVDRLGVDKEQVTPDASLSDDLGVDSLDAVELIMNFEEEFGMEIPDEDADKLKTVGDIIEYIKGMEQW